MIRSKLVAFCQNYHGLVHLLFGLLAYLISFTLFPAANQPFLLLVAIVAAFIPDADHILFYYTYGRHTQYAKTAGSLLLHLRFREYITYVSTHHKNNHYIWSHNLATPVICLFLFFTLSTISWRVFFLSFSFHFIFDILEDLLALGHLNPNWYFKFSSKNL